MAVTMRVVDSTSFNYIPAHGLLAEASDLGVNLHALADDMTERRIAVRSARTGEILQYERSKVDRDREGELQAVQYRPMGFIGRHTLTRAAAAQFPSVTIFND